MSVRNNTLFVIIFFALGFFAQQALFTLSGVMDSPRVQMDCAGGQGQYVNGHLLVNASEGSDAFSAYSWEGDLIKVHAMPWQFGPDHDLWVKDCVREIKEAAAAQQ